MTRDKEVVITISQVISLTDLILGLALGVVHGVALLVVHRLAGVLVLGPEVTVLVRENYREEEFKVEFDLFNPIDTRPPASSQPGLAFSWK